MIEVIVNTLFLIFIYSIIYVSGYNLNLLIHKNNKVASSSIAIGLISILIIAWFFKSLSSKSIIYVGFYFINLIIFFINYKKINLKEYFRIYPILLTSIVINFLVTKNNFQLITLGNNDVFNWAITADTLLGLPGYRNVEPNGSQVYETLIVDGYGSQVLLSIIAYFNGTLVLQSIPIFYLLISSISALAIYEIIKFCTNFNILKSYIIAFTFLVSPFYLYILYQGFIGQQIALFFFLIGILLILKIDKVIWISGKFPYQDLINLIIPLIGILISYQSAYLVYILSLFIFLLIYNYFENFTSIFKIVIFYFLLLLICFLVLPYIFIYTIERIYYVSSVNAGWPFDLISPIYFYLTFSNTIFPGNPTSLFIFTFYILIIILLVIVSKYINLALSNGLKSLSLLLVFSLIIYEIAYYFIGNKYQVWKYLSYTALPLSFVFICLIFTYLNKIFDKFKITKINTILVILFIFLLFRLYKINYKHSNFESTMQEFLTISNSIDKYNIRNIVLGTSPFSETMLAFNIFSNNFKLFSLSQTYIPASDPSLITSLSEIDTLYLVPRRCFEDGQLLYVFNNWALTPSLDFPTHINFDSSHEHCIKFNGLKLVNGFSSPEEWGVWSTGKLSSLKFRVPKVLSGRELRLELKLKKYSPQKVLIYNSDILVANLNVLNDDTYKFNVIVADDGYVNLTFIVSDPVSPFSFSNNLIDDQRLLGIGLVNLKILMHGK